MSTTNPTLRNTARPKVSILYSESSRLDSKESENLAFYISCCLTYTGYATVFMVPCPTDGCLLDPLPTLRKLSFVPPGQSKTIEIPSSDITFSHFNILDASHIIIITTFGSKNEIVSKKILEAIQTRKDVLIFSMQFGVRSGTQLKDLLSSKTGITFIECVVGFSVYQNPKTLTYISTVTYPKIAMFRLTNDLAPKVEGPASLIEATNIYIFYKKVISTHAWGTLIYETLYFINAIHGGTILESLKNYNCRKLYASMIRETRNTLLLASSHNKWRPNMELVSWIMTPDILEMILLLPWPLFYISAMLCNLPLPVTMSPTAFDLQENRNSDAANRLDDILITAKQYNYKVPVCEAVLEKLKTMNNNDSKYDKHYIANTENFNIFVESVSHYEAFKNCSNQYNKWLIRALGFVTFIIAICFLFTE